MLLLMMGMMGMMSASSSYEEAVLPVFFLHVYYDVQYLVLLSFCILRHFEEKAETIRSAVVPFGTVT